MNGVQVIILRTAKSIPRPARSVVILPEAGKVSGKNRERVFTGNDVSGSPDLLQQAEEKMLKQIKGEIDNFILIAGKSRALRAVEKLLADY